MYKPLEQPVCATNPLVFLDISIGQEFAGRMVIELRHDVVPKTAENFRALCTGEAGIGKYGVPLHYKGICFHKVTRLFVVQGGDVVSNDGTSGESIYGPYFDDENFILKHEEGVVSMANYATPNTNNSQFAITSACCDNLNGTNVVFGKVLRGFNIIRDMEQNTTDEGTPTKDIVIKDCGQLVFGEDWGIADNDETSDKLPPYPEDWEEKNKIFSSDGALKILTTIRNAGNHFYVQQSYHEARRKYRKGNRYFDKICVEDANSEEFKKFQTLNLLNIAAVELKLKKFIKAKNACTEALNIDNECSKAFYRRGQANIALNNYEDAINDLRKVHELLPDNKQILDEFNHAKKLLSDYNNKQKNALKNLFN